MRILHIINSLSGGGAEKLLVDLLPNIHQLMREEVALFVLSKNNDLYSKQFQEKGIKVVFSKYNSVKNPLVIFEIMTLFKQYDIIHTHLTQSQIFTAIARWLSCNKKVKLFYTEHSSYNKRHSITFWKKIDQFIYKQYNYIVHVSVDVEKKILQWLDNSIKRKSIVIDNGINLAKFENAKIEERQKWGFNSDDKLLIMVSRFNYQKDHETLIRTMKELPQSYKLILLGEGGLKEKYQLLVKELNLVERIFFLGFQSNVASFIKMSDIFILSSFSEGFGLVLVEAMACDKPVIGSNVGGIKGVVNVAGILFEQGNIEDLKNKILSLEDDIFYKKIQTQCFEERKKYDIKVTAQKYVELYFLNK